MITCYVERPARLRGYIATLSTRRDAEDRPFLYLIDEGQWVTADNGHGYRDEIDDVDWPKHVDDLVTALVEHGYYVRRLFRRVLTNSLTPLRPFPGTSVTHAPPLRGRLG